MLHMHRLITLLVRARSYSVRQLYLDPVLPSTERRVLEVVIAFHN